MALSSRSGIETAKVIEGTAFRRAMRGAAAGVSIVTSGQAPERHGLTVTAACSLSADPATILVCINKSAGAHDTIMHTGAFGWNVLAAGQVELARRFSGGAKGEIRFREREWSHLVTGAPILIDALCSFDCRVIDTYPAATHTVFMGAVLAEAHQDEADALVYRDGRFAVPTEISESGD